LAERLVRNEKVAGSIPVGSTNGYSNAFQSINCMLGLNDSNVWGFLAIPVGLALCFGPPLLLWIRRECSSKADPKDDKRP
jgi:hypothetical protein